jgi:hypothetical protein
VILRGLGPHGEVLEDGAVREERVLLRDVAGTGVDAFDGAAGDRDAARGGALLAEDHAQQRALAAAGLAEQDDELTGLDAERDVFEDDAARALLLADGIGDGDALDLDGGAVRRKGGQRNGRGLRRGSRREGSLHCGRAHA